MIKMRVKTPAISLSLKSAFFGLVLFFMSAPFAIGQSLVERLNNTNIVDGSVEIQLVETIGETRSNSMNGSIIIHVTDANRDASTYSVVYELHEAGNFQLKTGLPKVDGKIVLQNARNAEYYGLRVIRELDLKSSERYIQQLKVQHAAPIAESGANLRLCTKTFTDCSGTSRTVTNLNSGFYYNTSASYRPCGFFLADDCSITNQGRWHCIDGDLSSPGQYTQYSFTATGYAGVGLTALQASRLNWVVCNYAYDASGVSAAVWYITGTGGSANTIYNAAVAAVPVADGSAAQMIFYKSNVAGVQDMIKWECKSTCSDVITCEWEVNGQWTDNCNISVCPGSTIKIGLNNYTSGSTITWSGPNSFNSTGDWIVVTTNASAVHVGTYTATITKGSCTYTKQLNLALANNCATTITNWSFDCEDGKLVDEYGYNANCNTTTTATIPNTANIYQYVVELVYKGTNPGSSVQVTNAAGTVYTLNRSTPFGTSSNVWVYRGLITGSTSSITYTNTNAKCDLQSLVVYAFRNDVNASASSGIFTNMSGYNDIQTITLTIPADQGPRDLLIEVPISELTADGRYLLLKATAGSVTNQVFLYGPNSALPGATCCLAIPTITLANVPGSVTQVVITVDTRHSQNGQSVNGQSWVIASGVNVDVECFDCDLTANAGADKSICSGLSTSLSGSKSGGTAPFTYSWNQGLGTGQNKTVSPTTTTTYTLTVTDANGCTATDQVVVTVNSLPNAYAGPDKTICTGTSTTLTATGEGTYLWSTGATTAAITVNPIATTTYTVTVTNANGCTKSDQAIVTVNDLPNANAGPDKIICSGASTTLTATGGGTYLWSTGATSAAITVSPTVTTTYTVTVTNANGCTKSDQAIVTVNDLPNANAGPDKIICSGSSTTLTATGGGNYLWSTGATTAAITVSPTATTTYTVTVTNTNGCSKVDEAIVTVNDLPIANAGPDKIICSGASTTLTATGGGTYLWSNGATSAAITVNPTATTTYTVTVTNANGCSKSDDAIVSVNDLPIANAGPDKNICKGESATLTATGGGTYLWSTGATTPAITVSPTATTTYTVTVTNSNGCVKSDAVVVTVNDLPNANAGPDKEICIGGSTTLTATGGGTYLWSTGATTAEITVSPTTTTTYKVTVTNSNGCFKSDNVVVHVNSLPNANAGPDKIICKGTSTILTATGGGIYLWSTGATTASINVSPTVTTTYTVTVTDSKFCSKSDDVVVTVNDLPIANAGTDKVICKGESTTLTATGGGTYLWSTGATTAAITVSPTATTTYTVTVTNSNGCIKSDDAVVTVNDLPNANAGPDKTICKGESTTLTAVGGGTYLWSTGATTAAITVSPIVTTTYTVTVTNGNGCFKSDDAVVTVNPLPTYSFVSKICEVFVAVYNVEFTSNATQVSASSGTLVNNGNGNYTVQDVPNNTNVTITLTNNATGCARQEVITFPNCLCPPLTPPVSGGDKEICFGQTIPTLTVTSVLLSSVNWYDSAIGGTQLATNTTSYTPIQAGTYYAEAYFALFPGCNSQRTPVVLTINQNPVASAGDDISICSGTSTTLTATGGGTYLWSTGATTQSITVTPLVNTAYTVVVTNSNNCVDSDDVFVIVKDLPNPNAGPDKTICKGASVTLTATGGGTYLWSTGATTAAITVSPTVTTTYTVAVTNSNGCSKSDEVVVTVNDLPNANAGPDKTICNGASVTLTATGGGTYLWSTGATTAAITVSPTTTTTYTVTVTNSNGCIKSDDAVVTVNNLPNTNAGLDKTICKGASVTLTAFGGGTYLWSTGATSASITVSPTATTIYTVTVTDGNGCSKSDDAVVTVNDLPNANAGPDKSICNGGSTTLTATGGGTYLWSTGATTATIAVNPTATTTYTVTVTNSNGCIKSDDVVVTVNPLPTVEAGSDVIICEGSSTTLTAVASNGTGPFTYSWDNGLGVGAVKTVSPVVTTTYIVTVTDAKGCSAEDQVTVNVDPSFTSGINAPNTRCAGEGILFIADPAVPGASYSWTFTGPATPNASSDASQVVTWSAEGTFNATLVVTKGACIRTYNHPIVITQEVFAAAGPDKTICRGASTQIGGSPTGPNGANYVWTPNLFLNNNNSANPTSTPPVTITYTVEVTQNGCTRSESVTVFVDVNLNPKPEAGPDVTICNGESVLIGNLPALPAVTYQWSTANGDIANSNASQISVSPTATTKYYVVATNAAGCPGMDSVIVNVNPTPIANAGIDVEICDGIPYTLNASASGGTPGYTYFWDNGIGAGASHPVTPSQTTTYTVTVTDPKGCIDTDQITITVNPKPIANAGANQSTCGVETVTLSASASGGTPGYTYVWDNGLGNGANKSVSPTQTTVYTVTVTDAKGCIDTDEVRITVNEVPNVNVGADTVICSGSAITINANVTGGLPDYSYLWSNGATTASITVSPVATTTYSVVVTDANGCQDNDQIIVNVDPSFVSGINAPNTRCAGEGLLVAVSPLVNGATYEWFFSGPATPTTSTDPSVIVEWATPGIYGITLEVRKGACSKSYDHPINITQEVFAAAGPDKTICRGASTQIGGSPTGPAGANYLWTPNLFMNNNSVSNPFVTPPVTTTYTVQVTQNGCVSTESVTVFVDVFLNPKPEAGPDKAICLGESVTIGGPADPNAIFQQWSTALGDIPGAFDPFITVNPTVTTKYYVTAYNALGCPGKDSVVVTVNPKPEANAGLDKTICPGELVTLTASGSGGTAPYTYLWSNGAVTQSINVNPLITTIYTVTVTDANGCKDTDDATVNASTDRCASLGDYVWEDLDGDGQQDGNESGIAGVTVNLLNGSGVQIGTTTTDANGAYSFTGLVPGNYIVDFITPNGFTSSLANQGNDATDSDANPVNGQSPVVTLTSGETNNTIDAGFIEPASLGDYVWEDLDGDGQQDGNESGIPGVTVNLLNGSGVQIGSTTTDANGAYSFTGLAPGNYIVDFITPNGFTSSPANQGNDATDSDANPVNGQSPVVTLTSGENNNTIDAGFIEPASLGDYVWEDLDGDGQQDGNESGIPGVTVNLLNGSGVQIGSTTTDANGAYSFTGLAPGNYIVDFITPNGFTSSPANQGNDATDSDANPVNGQSPVVTLTSGENNNTIDAGFIEPASLGDYVWEDLDGDGQQDGNESGIPGVTVNLLNGSGVQIGTTTTDANGAYSFTGLAPGNYIVDFITPNGFTSSPANQGNDATDSDANPVNGQSPVVTLTSGENNNTIDAGFYKNCSVNVTASLPANCTGRPVTITANVSGGVGPYTYAWSTGQTSASFTVNPVQSTIFTVVVTDAIGCQSTDSVLYVTFPYPEITKDSAICNASLLTYNTGFSINLGTATASPGTLVNNGNGNYSVINVPIGQNVTITAISPFGCESTSTIQSPNCECPDIEVPTGVDSVVACDNKPLPTLVVFVPAGNTVDWYTVPVNGAPIAVNTTSYKPLLPGVYYAEARGIVDNCKSVQRLRIEVTTVDCKDCPTPDCLNISID
jgi:protocatechuate 3,4-dioxygenase beta subunit/predicted transcriptional regulator